MHYFGAYGVFVDFESILNCTSGGMVIVDRSLNVIYANSAAESLFQISKRQLCLRKFSGLYRDSSMPLDSLDRVFVNQSGFTDAEVDFVLEDNQRIVTEVHANFCSFCDDKPTVVIEIHPVTNQRKLSEESQKQLLHNATKQLIRGLAHEIKNPLGGLRGAAQLLHRELPTTELQEYTDMIIGQADRLTVLVDRLLGPNHPSSFCVQNIHSVIEKTRMLALMGGASNIRVMLDYDPSIPELAFDEHMIQQALLNVLNNAIQALAETEQPEITIKTRVERRLTIHGKRYPLSVVITISDNGPGIAEEVKETLFYPMITNKADGNGLGLSISQNLIEHHHGKIDVSSEPGFTQFMLYIPMSSQEAVNAK